MDTVATKAIILRRIKISPRRQILTALSPLGLISLSTNSKDSLDVLTEAEVIVQKTSGIRRLIEGKLLAQHIAIRQDLDKLKAALVIVHILLKTQLENKPSEALFKLVLATMAAIEKVKKPHNLALSFILKLLKLEGLTALDSDIEAHPALRTATAACIDQLLALQNGRNAEILSQLAISQDTEDLINELFEEREH